MSAYLHKGLDDVLNKHDEVSNLIWDIVDVQDTWDQAIERINEALLAKAV